MKNTYKYIFLMTIIPWLSVPFIGSKTFKRFLPGSLFMCFYLIVEGMIAQKKKWWWFPIGIKPNIVGEFPLIFGPFLVGSIWILKYTYGKFALYFKTNLLIDAFFTYLMIPCLKKIGYVSLVRLSKFRLSILFLIKSVVMYLFQYFYEKFRNQRRMESILER
ncbi:hypothetical protein H5P36_05640 [Bacillus sp. APMAM]|uniref:hypothetical protein n=1 Tax=Margalitia sp. FSL K6-0131 TaxID=2954604 RepID=UPI000F85D349|nr:hypothetical protein [Bacillus sp. APMAM]RTZ56885.1 hypothetical protein EKO25_05360 [Bacillus sp. SAJ1]